MSMEYRQYSREFELGIMQALGLKGATGIQSININCTATQFPKVEITKLLDEGEMKSILYLVERMAPMEEVPVEKPTHHYKFEPVKEEK